MPTSRWNSGTASPRPSHSIDEDAGRLRALLAAIADGLPGATAWHHPPEGGNGLGPQLSLDPTALADQLRAGRLRDDFGADLPGAGSRAFFIAAANCRRARARCCCVPASATPTSPPTPASKSPNPTATPSGPTPTT